MMIPEKIVKTSLIFLFIVFIVIYISYSNGYYEYELHKRVELTNEQIEKFESDVRNNENIDVNDYVNNTIDDYSNTFSDVGASFSSFTSKYVKEGINGVFKMISKLME